MARAKLSFADSIKEQKKKMNDLSKPSVLIVDDASANIDVVLGVLQSEYEMIVALDGPTALKIVESNKPDIILLDIMMPEMDGYEVCR